jgi:hypothetical protein
VGGRAAGSGCLGRSVAGVRGMGYAGGVIPRKEAVMKPSEYGGSDTDKTHGIQPAPHRMTPSEELRVMYSTDPMDPSAPPDPTQTK